MAFGLAVMDLAGFLGEFVADILAIGLDGPRSVRNRCSISAGFCGADGAGVTALVGVSAGAGSATLLPMRGAIGALPIS